MEANVPDSRAFHISQHEQWRLAIQSSRPILIHLNADTTWLLQLAYPETHTPPQGRSRFNILIDPWLQGSQCDFAPWFSRQWHVIASSVKTTNELNSLLASVERPDGAEAEPGSQWLIDAVVISHEFTDHCHQETLLELPPSTMVIASTKAAKMIRAWNHFHSVTTTHRFSSDARDWEAMSGDSGLPSWVSVSRIVTESSPLYLHSAILVAFNTAPDASQPEAIIYTPHGLPSSDLTKVKTGGFQTLALLHGLHDVRLSIMKQLNLGAMNGFRAAVETDARYWIATHDEVKEGKGLVGPLLKREQHTLQDAMEAEKKCLNGRALSSRFVQLGSGYAFLLE